MSVKTQYYNNIKWTLSDKTTAKLEDLVETKDRYVANIESDLRNLGEHEFANDLLNEIKEGLEFTEEEEIIDVITKRVRSQGNSGAIFVPRSWQGKDVKVLLLRDKE